MANVLFTRTSEPSSKPITDGQLIFDTSGNGKMYLDVGDERLEMGGAKEIDSVLNATSTNPIQNKAVAGVMLDNLSDINNVTRKGFVPDALAIKELNSSLGKEPTLLLTMDLYTNNQTIDFSSYRYILIIGGNSNVNIGQGQLTPTCLLPSVSQLFYLGTIGGTEYSLSGNVNGKTITFNKPSIGYYRIYGIS